MRNVITSTLLFVSIPAAFPASAKDFHVTDQDQVVINQICEAAARSPAINIDLNAQIAAWCVQWKGRMQAANVRPSTDRGSSDNVSPD